MTTPRSCRQCSGCAYTRCSHRNTLKEALLCSHPRTTGEVCGVHCQIFDQSGFPAQRRGCNRATGGAIGQQRSLSAACLISTRLEGRGAACSTPIAAADGRRHYSHSLGDHSRVKILHVCPGNSRRGLCWCGLQRPRLGCVRNCCGARYWLCLSLAFARTSAVCTYRRQQCVERCLGVDQRLNGISDHSKVQCDHPDNPEGIAGSSPPNLATPVRVCCQHAVYQTPFALSRVLRAR